MPPEPAIKRAVPFVDGQTLFFAARQAFGYTYPNYGFPALAAAVCTANGWQLEQARFYTGIPDVSDDPFWSYLWAGKLRTSSRQGVEVFSRSLRYRNKIVKLPNGSTHAFLTAEEKGIDVRIAIAVAGRGFHAHISTELDVPLPESACVYCGNCITVCPTGALMAKPEHELRQSGNWRPEEQTTTDTICPYCGVGCTLTVHVQDDRMIKIGSPLENSVTRGNLCVKGRFGFEYVHTDKPDGDGQA